MKRTYNNAYQRARKRHGTLFPDQFIERSGNKITQTVIDAQRLEVRSEGGRVVVIPPGMSEKNIKAVMKNMR